MRIQVSQLWMFNALKLCVINVGLYCGLVYVAVSATACDVDENFTEFNAE